MAGDAMRACRYQCLRMASLGARVSPPADLVERLIGDIFLVFQGNGLDVSIIIVNWNTRNLLHRCLQAIARGIGGVRAQILVVDNGSSDGSSAPSVAEEFPTGSSCSETLRMSASLERNNQAYQRVQGRYVLLLNPDTEVGPGSIEHMVQEFLNADLQRAGVTSVFMKSGRDGAALSQAVASLAVRVVLRDDIEEFIPGQSMASSLLYAR